jgi:hypothetical protein
VKAFQTALSTATFLRHCKTQCLAAVLINGCVVPFIIDVVKHSVVTVIDHDHAIKLASFNRDAAIALHAMLEQEKIRMLRIPT